MTCDSCGHDWHGLACAHDAVVRAGWSMRRESCDCLSAYAGPVAGGDGAAA